MLKFLKKFLVLHFFDTDFLANWPFSKADKIPPKGNNTKVILKIFKDALKDLIWEHQGEKKFLFLLI